jgi:hypothetical protein
MVCFLLAFLTIISFFALPFFGKPFLHATHFPPSLLACLLACRGAPHAVVLAKGKLWRTDSMEDIQDFAISEYEIGAAEDIPPLPSPLLLLLGPFLNLVDHPEGKVMAVMGLIAGSLILLLVIVLLARSMLFQAKPKPPAASHKKKN